MVTMRERGVGGRAARPLVVVLAVLAIAAGPAAMAAGPVGVDTAATTAFSPTAQSPTVRFTRLGRTGALAIPVTVTWPAAQSDGAAIARYELAKSLDGGAWLPVPLRKPLARSVGIKVAPWAVLRLRVRAVDTAEVAGEWAESAPLWMTAAQESDPRVELAGAWAQVADSAAYGRRRATTTTSGDTATFSFVGRQVAWIARLGPKRGQATVSADGESATNVSLYRARTSSRRIVYRKSWPTAGPHTLTVTAASAGAAVDIDAFIVVGDPVDGTLVGAGDIASCSYTRDSDTAALVSDVIAENPSARAFTVGDTVYPDGSAQHFADCYEPTWGAFKANTWPVIGNHEYYNNPGAAPYFAYFGANAGPAGQGWYRYESGTWRVYALTSECAKTTACYEAQLNWLKADLAAEPHRCVMAIWHRPLFSTGSHGNSNRMSDVFKVLYDSGADVVLAGHDHGYQRFTAADMTGTPDAARGIRQFVVGTGGASLYAFPTDSALIEVRDNTTHGVLRLDLAPGGYSWEFLPVPAADAFTDSGTGACH